MARQATNDFGCVIVQTKIVEIHGMAGGLEPGGVCSGLVLGVRIRASSLALEVCRQLPYFECGLFQTGCVLGSRQVLIEFVPASSPTFAPAGTPRGVLGSPWRTRIVNFGGLSLSGQKTRIGGGDRPMSRMRC